MKYSCKNKNCKNYDKIINLTKVKMMIHNNKLIKTSYCKECGEDMEYLDKNELPSSGVFKGSSNF